MTSWYPIIKKNKKIIRWKEVPTNVSIVPLDNMSFHFEKSFLKWKFRYHRRIAPERDLSKEALNCEEIVSSLRMLR